MWSWKLLRGGEFRLDGGAMFGMAPRVVWTRDIEPDDKNRIPLQQNSLLLERDGKLTLVEVGIGDKFGQKERGLYAQEDRCVLDALREEGVGAGDISTVILTHLHFDHAGGLTRLPHASEGDGPVATFPNAEIVVQRREWDDAKANKSTMHSTYLPAHLTPEIEERLRLVDTPCAVLHEDDPQPDVSSWFAFEEVLPGNEVFRTPGHTRGQQCVRIDVGGGRKLVYVSDVMPTVAHSKATANMAYDVDPFVSGLQRASLLTLAERENWLLALDHEPSEAVRTARAKPDRPGAWILDPA